MNPSFLSTPCLLALALFSAPSPMPSQQPPTQQVEVRDPVLNNMVAWTGTIPAGWHFEGHVQRQSEGATAEILVRMSSPDNLITYQSYPALITTDIPSLQGTGILCPRTSSIDLLKKYVAPHLFPEGKDANDPTRNPPQTMGDGNIVDANILSLHTTQGGRPFSTGILGYTIYSDKPAGHYFAVTFISTFSGPAGHEHEITDTVLPLKREASSQWLQADHQHSMSYYQARSNQISNQGTAAILNGAATQRASQDALFHASMTNAANSEHARHEGAEQTIDNISGRTRIYVWHNTISGESATTTTSYPPAGGNWVQSQ